MNKSKLYNLYKFRKTYNEYPADFAGIQIDVAGSWLIIDRQLDYAEIEMYDLEARGKKLSYDQCQNLVSQNVEMKRKDITNFIMGDRDRYIGYLEKENKSLKETVQKYRQALQRVHYGDDIGD